MIIIITVIIIIIYCYINTVLELMSIAFSGGIMYIELQLVIKTYSISV